MKFEDVGEREREEKDKLDGYKWRERMRTRRGRTKRKGNSMKKTENKGNGCREKEGQRDG